MTIFQRGKSWNYNFMMSRRRYRGVCPNCTTRDEAIAYEKKIRNNVSQLKAQKSVKALVENFREELSGGKTVLLSDAWALSSRKPRARGSSESWNNFRKGCWDDFAAYVGKRHPELRKLSQIEKSVAEEYVSYVREKGRFIRTVKNRTGGKDYSNPNCILSEKSCNEIQTAVCGIFQLLMEDAGLLKNPFDGIPKMRKNEESRDVFTPEEIKSILESDDDFCRPLFLVALFTGLREGDICNMRWSDYDGRRRMICLTQHKTGNAVSVPVMDYLADFLDSIPRTAEYILERQHDVYSRERSAVSLRIKRFLEGLGIETTKSVGKRSRKVSVKDLHSCRHTFCWLAGQAGIPLPTVQSIVGHMSPEMTAHYAAHVSDAQKLSQISALESILPTAGRSPRRELEETVRTLSDDMAEKVLAYVRRLCR